MKYIFFLALFLGLVLIGLFFLKKKMANALPYVAAATIANYRIITYITIYFYGRTSWWNDIYRDKLNHYQLGIALLILVYLLRKAISPNVRTILSGMGWGMLIDEVSDLLKLLPFVHLPSHFRDSLADLLLIVLTYLLFVVVTRVIRVGARTANE